MSLMTLANDRYACDKLERVAQICSAAINEGNKIMLCGNGGSAADAQHIAAELVGRFEISRPGLAAIALTTDTSILTAVGNDYGYENVFARQMEAIGKSGDVLIAISTSGNSKNILNAVAKAAAGQIKTIGFTGRDGGELAPMCDIVLKMPSDRTSRIQESHILCGHIICELIEKALFGGIDEKR